MIKTKKKIIYFILSLFFVFSICFLLFVKNYYDVRDFLNPNSFDFELSKKIDKTKIDVYWNTDFKNSIKIISKGQSTGEIYKKYGKNIFTVTYENDTVGTFQYFKFNNWHGHEHLVKLTENNNSEITFDIKIKGPDEERLIK